METIVLTILSIVGLVMAYYALKFIFEVILGSVDQLNRLDDKIQHWLNPPEQKEK